MPLAIVITLTGLVPIMDFVTHPQVTLHLREATES